MGKGCNLWDDSALINAFDNAMTTYKETHCKTYTAETLKKEKLISDNNKDAPALSEKTTEECQDGDNGESNVAVDSHMHSFNTEAVQENKFGAELDTPDCHTQSSGFPGTDIVINNTKDQQTMDYEQLLRQYYELEEQKQKVVEQLNQANYLSHQIPVQCSMGQAHQVPAFDASSCSLHPTCGHCSCTCLVPVSCGAYSSPAWAACCSASHALTYPVCQCPAGTQTCSIATSCLVDPLKQSTQADDYAVKTGMIAVERAMASMQKEIFVTSNACEETGTGTETETETETENVKDKGMKAIVNGNEGSHGFSSGTDLSVALSAWYAAGFHTGRYLTEQSMKDLRRDAEQ